ncbi:unnamed protein product [Adineta steineri]|uniref:Uncharacterized protein n=1 Tax=Adineta steineri TaxID=433720 RepID=A0A819KPH8_9BILA|nr:unnamed protein product [Adineta steineri]
MWLFSGSVVELPAKLRARRCNIVLMSIWLAYVEPHANLIELFYKSTAKNKKRRSYFHHMPYPNNTQWKELENKAGCKKNKLQVSGEVSEHAIMG